jgi:maltooligosyltrehalose trehalohydrolase
VRIPLKQGADGWWSGRDLVDGDLYGFVLDGKGPFPDPRSAYQPGSVHGLSQAVDTDAFKWTDTNWQGVDARGAVIYELHVGAFTAEGTLDAAAAELPRLAAAGIQIVELMPLAPFPGRRGWGYDGVGLYAVHEAYGGPAALQRFVDKAHALGLGVCLDVVHNHLGPDGNYLGQFGPYFTDAHHTPWGSAINLDQEGSKHVRAFLIDSAVRWFTDFHVDALRLDAVHELKDDSPRHFLAELAYTVGHVERRLGRPLSLIAESDLNNEAMVTPTDERGLGMDLQWADDVHHALHAYLTGERHGYYAEFGSIEVLDHVYRHVFWHDGRASQFRGKPWGAPVRATTDRRAFVVFASNHDQVGNRALGDRPSASLTPGAQATAIAMVLLSPFTPMLFMGEEYGETTPFQFFTDHEPGLGAAVTKGRLDEFAHHGWEALYGRQITVPDPQSPASLEASRLANVDSDEPRFAQAREWMTTCIAAREHTLSADAWARHPVAVTESPERAVTLHGPVRVHANLTDAPVEFQLDAQCTLVGAFGGVEKHSDVLVMWPDSVALVLAGD